MSDWTFLSDHAHVLVLLARNPRSDVPALARECGLEAAEIGVILRDLEQADYIHREDAGSATYLIINRDQPLRHPVERHHPVGRLLDAVESPADILLDRLGRQGLTPRASGARLERGSLRARRTEPRS